MPFEAWVNHITTELAFLDHLGLQVHKSETSVENIGKTRISKGQPDIHYFVSHVVVARCIAQQGVPEPRVNNSVTSVTSGGCGKDFHHFGTSEY